MKDPILATEYCERFDDIRKNLIKQSYYKYGPCKTNFAQDYVDAIGSLKKCLAKFEETKNLEYLADVANYAMFRFMYPKAGEFFKYTDSDGSAGVDGMSINEIKRFKEDNDYGF